MHGGVFLKRFNEMKWKEIKLKFQIILQQLGVTAESKTQGTYKLPIIHDKKVKKNALV